MRYTCFYLVAISGLQEERLFNCSHPVMQRDFTDQLMDLKDGNYWELHKVQQHDKHSLAEIYCYIGHTTIQNRMK